jgi:anti-anti-sigma factor
MAEGVMVTVRKRDDVAILDMKGEVTSFADDTLNSLVKTTVEEGIQRVAFNFSDVSYINSSGIAVLIGIVTGFTNKGVSFNVYGLSSHFKKIFRMIGLTQYVNVFGSEDEAVTSFS